MLDYDAPLHVFFRTRIIKHHALALVIWCGTDTFTPTERGNSIAGITQQAATGHTKPHSPQATTCTSTQIHSILSRCTAITMSSNWHSPRTMPRTSTCLLPSTRLLDGKRPQRNCRHGPTIRTLFILHISLWSNALRKTRPNIRPMWRGCL